MFCSIDFFSFFIIGFKITLDKESKKTGNVGKIPWKYLGLSSNAKFLGCTTLKNYRISSKNL